MMMKKVLLAGCCVAGFSMASAGNKPKISFQNESQVGIVVSRLDGSKITSIKPGKEQELSIKKYCGTEIAVGNEVYCDFYIRDEDGFKVKTIHVDTQKHGALYDINSTFDYDFTEVGISSWSASKMDVKNGVKLLLLGNRGSYKLDVED